jgi:hypothetical protein
MEAENSSMSGMTQMATKGRLRDATSVELGAAGCIASSESAHDRRVVCLGEAGCVDGDEGGAGS